MIYFDTESVGFTGPMVLLQWAEEDGPIHLYEVFKEPVGETLRLIERIVNSPVVGFNLAHDWFHLTKTYNILKTLYDHGYNDIPTVDAYWKLEPHCRKYYLRPPGAMDLMLHARRGPYQSTMARKDIRIRKVPNVLADQLATELLDRIELPDIYFAKSSKGYQWDVDPIDDDFCNLVLRFRSSSGLGALCEDALGEPKGDWPFPKWAKPSEEYWRPYHNDWKDKIGFHIATWGTNGKARYYADRDVYLTRRLHKFFGSPPPGDTDSILACDVGASRWIGYTINESSELLISQRSISESIAHAPKPVKRMLETMLSDAELSVISGTDRKTLESLCKSSTDKVREYCEQILGARRAAKRVGLLERLATLYNEQGLFFPDFKIIGTKSNRMSGGSEDTFGRSINPQGIPAEPEFRRIFRFAGDGEQLDGGDFKSFEVVIMAAVYGDENLTRELADGKKFHALMGQVWFNEEYEAILNDKAKYYKSKQADFGWAYGAQEPKLAEVTGQSEEEMHEANERLRKLFPEVARRRAAVQQRFCSMRQPGGIGSRVVWHDPAEYIENLFGFRRYFTLENKICRALFEIAQDPPKYFREIPARVVRRNRVQTAGGATQSALFAAAFNIQAQAMRAAANHEIQSTGAEITKAFQRALNDLQPTGIHLPLSRSMNIHDELVSVHRGQDTRAVIEEQLAYYRKYIPLLDIDWKTNLNNWSDIK